MTGAGTIVLAYSGGLDTSFCVPWLVEHGWRVVTLFVDTGGVTAARRDAIERRALELGAAEHVTEDASAELWSDVIVPLIRAGGPTRTSTRCSAPTATSSPVGWSSSPVGAARRPWPTVARRWATTRCASISRCGP